MRFAAIFSTAVIAVCALPAFSLPFGFGSTAYELQARDVNEHELYARDIYVEPPPHNVRPSHSHRREVDDIELYERDLGTLLEARERTKPKLTVKIPADAKPQYGVHRREVDDFELYERDLDALLEARERNRPKLTVKILADAKPQPEYMESTGATVVTSSSTSATLRLF